MKDPIVITGAGIVSPMGTGREACWKSFVAGESGIRKLSEDDTRFARGVDPDMKPRIDFAAFVRDFSPREIIQSKQMRRMDWISRMLVGACRLAVDDANADEAIAEASDRIAIVSGSCFGPQRETQEYLERVFTRGLSAGQPFLFPNLVLNAAAGWAAIELKIQGPNVTVSEHEASGEAAIVTAIDLIEAGIVDIAIGCGVEEFGDVLTSTLRDRHLLDSRCLPTEELPNRTPRRGMIPGEGAAAIVLERASHARKRAKTPIATVADATMLGTGDTPHGFPRASEAAARVGTWLGESRIDALIGGTAGGKARQQIDVALREELDIEAFVSLRELVGDWLSAGVFATALAGMACESRHRPGPAIETATRPELPASGRILVTGAGRGGMLAPIIVAPFEPAGAAR